jgi:hypothetical protein
MKERLERRVLGAIRWLDHVSKAVVAHSLDVRSDNAAFTRNLSGLTVITAANGLEEYGDTFDLKDLRPAAKRALGSIVVGGTVQDPSGHYLPRAFKVMLPRDPTPGSPRPADSLFAPKDLELLPTAAAKTLAGWAQVRVTVLNKATGKEFRDVLVRVVTAGNHRVLGLGMSDARGEALVVIPGLPLFGPGETAATMVTSETSARAEFIPPPPGTSPVDWTELDATAAADANVSNALLALKAGQTFSLNFSVTT